MKKSMMRLTVLTLLLTVVQGAWAQTGVSTEAALKEAMENNQSVKLNGDKLDDQISAIDEFTHGTPCRYCAGYRNHEGHQVPSGSSSKCPACSTTSCSSAPTTSWATLTRRDSCVPFCF